MYPENYYYTKEHEWASVDGDIMTVGITDYAQNELGDIVFVELPEVGSDVECEGSLGSIESVKAVSDMHSPATGKVAEVNEDLEDAPELLNESPHGDGWIAKIEITDKSQLDELMDASEYEEYLANL